MFRSFVVCDLRFCSYFILWILIDFIDFIIFSDAIKAKCLHIVFYLYFIRIQMPNAKLFDSWSNYDTILIFETGDRKGIETPRTR